MTRGSAQRYFVGGGFTSFDGNTARKYQVSLIENHPSRGTVDTYFNPNLEGPVTALGAQTGGKIIVGMSSPPYIRRLNVDGSNDLTFQASSFNGTVHAIEVLSDGKIWVGGAFTSANSIQAYRIIRLNSDGSTDTGFSPYYGANGPIYTLASQPDGKVIIGGSFSTVGPSSTIRNNIARMSGGMADSAFATGGTDGPVYTVKLQTDGKIVIGGTFSSYNSNSRNRLARLGADGIIDSGFSVGTGFVDGTVYALAPQSDGSLIVGGLLSTYNSIPVKGVVKLRTNGSIDPYFSIDGTDNPIVLSLAPSYESGSFYIAGAFNYVGGVNNVRICRLYGWQ